MQSNPRIVVNLLVISANILVRLPVKLAKLRVRGAIGAPGPGNTLGRGSYDLQLVRMRPEAIAQSPSNPWSGMATRLLMRLMRLLLGIIARIARNITNITRFTRIILGM